MTTNDPDAIRADIERTRAQLSDDVNALADQTNPRTVAENQVQKVKDKVGGVRDAVFGAPEDPYDDGKVGQAKDALSDKAHGVAETVSDKAHDLSAKRATRGHPLAAGLIAFGLGALLGGAAPSSQAEQRAGTALKEKAQPLVEGVTDAAKESVAQLKEPAQQAADELKQHVAAAGDTVKQQVSSESDRVKEQVASSKDEVSNVAAQATPGGGSSDPGGHHASAGQPLTDPTFTDEPLTEDERHIFERDSWSTSTSGAAGVPSDAEEDRQGRFIEEPLDVRPYDDPIDDYEGRRGM